MANKEVFFEEIKKVLVEEMDIPEERITMEASLQKDLGISSLDLADLAMMCAEKLETEIEDEDLHSLLTIADVVNLVEKNSN